MLPSQLPVDVDDETLACPLCNMLFAESEGDFLIKRYRNDHGQWVQESFHEICYLSHEESWVEEVAAHA